MGYYNLPRKFGPPNYSKLGSEKGHRNPLLLALGSSSKALRVKTMKNVRRKETEDNGEEWKEIWEKNGRRKEKKREEGWPRVRERFYR